MAQDDAQERTEQPTQKRLREARSEGQIARSRELNTLGMMLASAGGLVALGAGLANELAHIMRLALSSGGAGLDDSRSLVTLLARAVQGALLELLPLLAILVATALLVPTMLGGWSMAGKALQPKWERIDPIKGLGRIFSANGLMELVKAVLKLSLVAGIAAVWIWQQAPAFIALAREPLAVGIAHAAYLIGSTFLILLLPLVVIAVIDAPFQVWQHQRKLRMTRRELKDEMKETDGSPELRARIRRQQQEVSRQRMMERVPDADVVVTNPTHYAVALAYAAERMRAPVAVAKGVDRIALRILDLAKEHRVPVVEAPALARALHHSTELDQPIPRELYVAVAHVLAYVHRLRRLGRIEAGTLDAEALPIPTGLRRD
jgi:flagellar biosynthetic protein FlhB